jgi:hypothetical protein
MTNGAFPAKEKTLFIIGAEEISIEILNSLGGGMAHFAGPLRNLQLPRLIRTRNHSPFIFPQPFFDEPGRDGNHGGLLSK